MARGTAGRQARCSAMRENRDAPSRIEEMMKDDEDESGHRDAVAEHEGRRNRRQNAGESSAPPLRCLHGWAAAAGAKRASAGAVCASAAAGSACSAVATAAGPNTSVGAEGHQGGQTKEGEIRSWRALFLGGTSTGAGTSASDAQAAQLKGAEVGR